MKNRNVIALFFGGLIVVAVSFLIFSNNAAYIESMSPGKKTFIQGNEYKNSSGIKIKKGKYIYNVEQASITKNSKKRDVIDIKGWIIKKGVREESTIIKVALKKNSGLYYLLPTTVTYRSDVTNVINDGTSYNYSGFSVHMPVATKLKNIKSKLYIVFEENGSERIIKTNSYLK